MVDSLARTVSDQAAGEVSPGIMFLTKVPAIAPKERAFFSRNMGGNTCFLVRGLLRFGSFITGRSEEVTCEVDMRNVRENEIWSQYVGVDFATDN